MDLSLARELMVYAADLLKYRCPDDLPEIRVEPDLGCLGQFRWSFLGTDIALKHWREGNLKDQSTLVHELVHWVQSENDVPMTGNNFYQYDKTEIEAITAQCRWLLSKGENPKDHLSEASVLKMTGDPIFSKMEWL